MHDICVVESMEASACLAYWESKRGVPDGFARCDCGRAVPERQLQPIDPSPYASGVCWSCALEAYPDEPYVQPPHCHVDSRHRHLSWHDGHNKRHPVRELDWIDGLEWFGDDEKGAGDVG